MQAEAKLTKSLSLYISVLEPSNQYETVAVQNSRFSEKVGFVFLQRLDSNLGRAKPTSELSRPPTEALNVYK